MLSRLGCELPALAPVKATECVTVFLVLGRVLSVQTVDLQH